VMSEPVMVLVGEKKEKFFIHAHLLKLSSKYFEKRLNLKRKRQSLYTDRIIDTVEFLAADTFSFTRFSKWLYTGHFHFPNVAASQATNDLRSERIWNEILASYKLSVVIEAPSFGDAAIDALTERMKMLNDSPIDLAKQIFLHTMPDSLHRKFCRDIVVHTWDRSKFNILWKDDFPREFIDSVLEEVGSRLDSGVRRQTVASFLASKSTCAYHDHERLKEPCYKAMFGG
ncbi:hypothetical protein DE146DRAFT_607718, partial [Phaeosphaeria sp. MPI-PUGE-AT-0046c]